MGKERTFTSAPASDTQNKVLNVCNWFCAGYLQKIGSLNNQQALYVLLEQGSILL